ncbi:MAG: hypothetical protein V3V85_04875, partial [Candidatus Thorarchaeota archaeon]
MPKKKLPDLDQIKFRCVQAQDGSPCKGKWRFGTFEKWGGDAEKHWPKNYVVADAISGEQFLVPNNDDWEVVEIPHGPWSPPARISDEGSIAIFDDEYNKFIEKEYRKALKKSKALNGCVSGKLFKVGVADGYATYIITRAGKRNVTIEWRNFACDSYYD